MTIEELLLVENGELGRIDIARLNLNCAFGLPGSEESDVAGCLRIIDEWADHVREETEKWVPVFELNPRRAKLREEFDGGRRSITTKLHYYRKGKHHG